MHERNSSGSTYEFNDLLVLYVSKKSNHAYVITIVPHMSLFGDNPSTTILARAYSTPIEIGITKSEYENAPPSVEILKVASTQLLLAYAFKPSINGVEFSLGVVDVSKDVVHVYDFALTTSQNLVVVERVLSPEMLHIPLHW